MMETKAYQADIEKMLRECKIDDDNIQKNKLNISDIIGNEDHLNNYIDELNQFIKMKKPTLELIEYARSICYGLPSEEELTEILRNSKNIKDKGLFGKIVEYGLFGQKPNSYSTPDLIKLGYDIKACAFTPSHIYTF